MADPLPESHADAAGRHASMTPRAAKVAAADGGLPPRSTQLHIVTGKGGTGKTTVAAALALALASGGKRVLLCEVEGRQGIASLFDVAPLPYAERPLAIAPGGGRVSGLAIDAEAALLEYLDMFYRLGRAGKALDKFGVIDFATTIAPGLRDVLLIGKVYEAARRRTKMTSKDSDEKPAFVYDAVVLDAPPTGRIGKVLHVNADVAGIAKVGPIRNQADSIMRMLRSPRTRVHIVTTLEEMPVQETIDAIGELTAMRLAIGTIIVNLAHDSELTAEQRSAVANRTCDVTEIERALKEAGVKSDESAIEELLAVARDNAARIDVEIAEQEQLAATGVGLVTLPFEPDGIDLGVLYDLARVIVDSGAFSAVRG